MLDPIYEAIGWLLAVFFTAVPNLGVAIILLTFAIMLVLYPLTAKQAKSMIAMQRVQPEVKKLQAKYKNDRQKLNEEMMKFYQENKINPLAGCLPLVVQLPIFFSLFQVLRDSYKYVPTTGALAGLYEDLCTKGGVLLKTAACGKEGVNHLDFLSMDLQKSATDSHGGVLSAVPYFALVGLVMFTGFMQTRQAQKRTPVANKQMGMVMRILPVFFGLISLNFPAGLVLYFFVSNLWRLGQQEVIFRRHGTGAPVSAKGTSIDVRSTERPGKTRPETVEEVVEPEERSRPRERTPRSGAPEGSGGLRGLFRLPAPPEGNAPPPARPAKSSGSGTRPPQQRQRKSKKKRKR
jgi:YidC/Oxa1 family membrane protein insertase